MRRGRMERRDSSGCVHRSFMQPSSKLPGARTGPDRTGRKGLEPMKKWIALSALSAMLAAPLAAQDAKAPAKDAEKKEESKMHRTPSGLQYEDTVVGTG